MVEIFEDQHAAAFAEHKPVPAAIKRPARLRRFVVAARQGLEQHLPHQAQRIDLALRPADEEEVRLIAADDAIGLTKSEQTRDVAFRDAVIWPLSVMKNGDVA